MNHFVVIFNPDGTVRAKKDINPEEWKGKPNVAIDPDLSAVSGIPPHEWRLVAGKVLPKVEARPVATPAPQSVAYQHLATAVTADVVKAVRWKAVAVSVLISALVSGAVLFAFVKFMRN